MIALVDAIDEHGAAIEYDLIRAGSRLRDFPDNGVTWRDLWVLITQAQPDSAIYKALGEHWQRTPELEIQREMEWTLRILAWQNAGGKGEAPERIPLPWDPPRADRPDSMDWDEAFEWLGWVDPTASLN